MHWQPRAICAHFPGYSGEGLPATSSALNIPNTVTCDGVGGLYIGKLMTGGYHTRQIFKQAPPPPSAADQGNAAIRFVSASGVMTTLAGALISNSLYGPAGYMSGPTSASTARMSTFQGVLSDGAGGALCGGEPAAMQ